ncbi:isochorismatase family protein [Citrobacter meridianamericanus]|uniref:Isochorismatase family protein n=1 Tax=Citrobacter meridianamericanus TaxID=2894201 RepID=A0ABT1B865_9ENTR|nr:isochorismatase family protein [Citrobacter meridianamericanus]MCO5781379.1 isochorismatase family protein [Citrobacter meridianamericanus]
MSIALLIIDMQQFVQDRIDKGVGYYPADAIKNIKYMLNKFREKNATIIHIIHQSEHDADILSKNSPFYYPLVGFDSYANEPVFIKKTSSAFASTMLKKYLDDSAISEVIVIGAVAGFCINSTVRHGADLGVAMTVVKDAVISFDLLQGRREEKIIHDVTMNLLEADFARITSIDEY